jgi:hypothetical protein
MLGKGKKNFCHPILTNLEDDDQVDKVLSARGKNLFASHLVNGDVVSEAAEIIAAGKKGAKVSDGEHFT